MGKPQHKHYPGQEQTAPQKGQLSPDLRRPREVGAGQQAVIHPADRRDPTQKPHVCDSTSRERPEEANPREQKADWWSPEAAGRGVWGRTTDGRVLELDSESGHTTL